jgi:hypothetical protein
VEARLVARFVVDPFLIFGLLVLATLSRWPLVPVSLAALLVVRIVWTACVSLARTRRELVALGDDDEPLDAEEPRLASEVEDDPDESWPKLLLGLAVLYVQVFFLYVGPFLAVLAGVVAWRAEAPTKPAVVAAVLALGAALAWWRAPERAEEAR